jgi:hypothetical protein
LEHDLKDVGIRPIMDLVARHSWWVSPKVYKEMEVVYPLTRRKKGTSEKRNQVVGGIRLWDNQPASHAFWLALGEDTRRVENFYVCHIYEGSVWDLAHFTNLANLVAFPKCLQSLSEWRPVTEVLKYHSFATYGYKGPNGRQPQKPKYYPYVWQHQANFSGTELERIVNRLREQRENRPGYKGPEQAIEVDVT